MDYPTQILSRCFCLKSPLLHPPQQIIPPSQTSQTWEGKQHSFPFNVCTHKRLPSSGPAPADAVSCRNVHSDVGTCKKSSLGTAVGEQLAGRMQCGGRGGCFPPEAVPLPLEAKGWHLSVVYNHFYQCSPNQHYFNSCSSGVGLWTGFSPTITLRSWVW